MLISEHLETLTDHLKAKRLMQHILQRELAEKLGVTTCSVTNWENGRNNPQIYNIPSITKFLGYALIKHHPMGGWRQTLLNDRLQKGLRRYKYAKLIGIDVTTLLRAELGRRILNRSENKILEFLKTIR